MAGRIPELSFASRGMDVDVEPDQVLTPQLVDAAVESVLEPYDEDVRERYRAAWAADETSEVARLLQSAMVSRTARLKSYVDASRRSVTVGYSLTADEQIMVSKRYPEMELRFMSNRRHDHALGAVDRLLSDIRLHSKMPSGMRYPDFGGSILMHVEQGNTDVVVVGGLHDVKDAARSKMVHMRLRKLSVDMDVSENTRNMAISVLAGEGKYYQEGSLQTFQGRFAGGVMSHVYDVPLIEIPKMMNRTGMLLFEGVIHFSSRFFFEEEGELPGVGARFKIDQGSFQMGFVDSPSHWYGHDWEEFSHYGADQILRVDGACYSYKIYENRGDTISFRILRVETDVRDPGPQYMQRPGVPMVQVSSYEHEDMTAMMSGSLTSVERLYPRDVWDKMVRAAMLDSSRGDLDFNKHIKTYKSVVAGHKYNGISTVSELVDIESVPWIVVDSALYGLRQVTLLRKSARAFSTDELERRVLAGSSTLHLTLKAFVMSVQSVARGLSAVVRSFFERVLEGGEFSVDRLVSVSVRDCMVKMKGRELVTTVGGKPVIQYGEFPTREQALKDRSIDSFVKAVLADTSKEKTMEVRSDKPEIVVNGSVVSDGTGVRSRRSSITLVERSDGFPSWVPFVGDRHPIIKEEAYVSKDYHTSSQRKDAVIETVRAVQAEHKQIETWSADRFSRYAGGRFPDAREVARVREENKNFDFWQVNSGVLQQTSLLGTDVSNFDYAGVFCPEYLAVPDIDEGVHQTRMIPVEDTTYENVLKGQFRSYKSLPVDYTGFVMVSDGMKILNGPHVFAGLKVASNMSFEFEAGVMEGGPGCGKSFTIVENYKTGDMVITPLRKSAEDIREKLVRAKKLTPKAALRVVRTLDSLAVEAGKTGGLSNSRATAAFMVHVDECFNASAGRVYGALALLNAQRAMMYGDRRQIEPVVRADIELTYLQVEAQYVVKRWTIFRSAAEILACYNVHYDYKLRTANKQRGTVSMLKNQIPVFGKDEDVLLLVMNQAAKVLVKRCYPGRKVEIATTHESQGGEADKVILFNFEVRKIGKENPVYLYNRERYVNVAISRTKLHFIYCFASDHADLVKEWIEVGRKPELIHECSVLVSAGKSAI